MRALTSCGILYLFVADDLLPAAPIAEATTEIPLAVSVAGTASPAGNGQAPPGQSFPAGNDSAGAA